MAGFYMIHSLTDKKASIRALMLFLLIGSVTLFFLLLFQIHVRLGVAL